MERLFLTPASEAEWLDWRKQDITSTEIAALFGASPYCTEFELFHRKAGSLPADDFAANERMKWGNRLEAAIAYGIAEDYGLIVEPFKVYARVPSLRIGSSFDFKIVGLADGFTGPETARDMFRRLGPGTLELKNVDGLQFRRTWIEDSDEIEAPPHIELQAQYQLEVAGLNWCIIGALVGGNTPKTIIRERDTELGALMREKVERFWAMVDAGIQPQPDFVADADAIGRLYVENDGSAVDLSDNPRVYELCREYKDAGVAEKVAVERKKAARAELLTIIQQHKRATAPGFKISAGTRRESFRAYHREAGERVSITISQIPAAPTATVPAYRDVRITEAA